MAVSRLARRMANRLGKAVGDANKHLASLGKADIGKKLQTIRRAERHQFAHFTRDLLRKARAEEEAIFGKTPSRLRQPKHLHNLANDYEAT